MSTAAKKPPSGGVNRVSITEKAPSPSVSPSRSTNRSSTPTGPGHARSRSLRTGTPVSARAAAARRDTTLSNADSDILAEASSKLEDLQQRLGDEEKQTESYKKQIEVLESKLDESVKESARLEEKSHEQEEQIELLKNEKKESTRQIREMETIYEAEKSSMLKEKEEMANKDEEMQDTIQRLKDRIAQGLNNDDDARPSRQGNSSPALSGGSFAPPSSVQRSDSRSSSKLILQKDKLIESLRMELAEAHFKLVKSENQGDGRQQEVERLLMEARMANARLVEDNESYQLLLQERTLKGDFGTNDFSYMGTHSNQDALNALEGKTGGGSSLADELSEATENEGDSDRKLEAELKAMKEQNKALTLYINKIIERLLQHQDFEHILDQSTDPKPSDGDANASQTSSGNRDSIGSTLLQRAKSIAGGPKKPRPASIVPTPNPNSAHTNPDTAPSIPVGNLTRSTSVRRSRPQSEQFTGAASLVSQMYKGPDGPLSPPLSNSRHSQTFFSPPSMSGNNPNASARVPSSSAATSSGVPSSSMKSETSSIMSEQSGGDSVPTPPSQSPPRSHSDKQTTFSGGKPRPLRLLQENPDAVKDKDKDNKRASWYTGWGWGKKDEVGVAGGAVGGMTGSLQPKASIPE